MAVGQRGDQRLSEGRLWKGDETVSWDPQVFLTSENVNSGSMDNTTCSVCLHRRFAVSWKS